MDLSVTDIITLAWTAYQIYKEVKEYNKKRLKKKHKRKSKKRK